MTIRIYNPLKWAALMLAGLLLLAAPATARRSGAWEQHVVNVIALRYWGHLPPCGHPRVRVEDLGSLGDGEADINACTVVYNAEDDWVSERSLLCEITIHEWGHLILGPQHSADPANVMYPVVPDLPVCWKGGPLSRRQW